MERVRFVLATLRNAKAEIKTAAFDVDKKKLKLRKNKYNDNYNEVPSSRLFDDLSRYWALLFNINWAVMDPEFNRDSICKLNSFACCL